MPGFWRNETSGVLRPAVERYLNRKTKPEDIPIMRAYVRQWVAGDFRGEGIAELRASVDEIINLETLDAWINRAIDAGIDPL